MKNKIKRKTLLVDGTALFKTAYYGAKHIYSNYVKIGGLYYSVNMLRNLINKNQVNRVVVFWDGENTLAPRKQFYPWYKDNRSKNWSIGEEENYTFQRIRVQEYFEELFIRQHETFGCEGDDAIAYYILNKKKHESILIVSNDQDMIQLIADDVYLYLLNKKIIINPNNFKVYFNYHHKNSKLMKILCGDTSDNIHGIWGLSSKKNGEKNLFELFPDLRKREMTLGEIFNICKENLDNKICKNVLSGKSSRGVFGPEFYEVNKKIIDLSKPLISEESKENVDFLLNEKINPDGRDVKNLLNMMIEDGVINLIPGRIENFEGFVLPFFKIIRSEKKS